MKKSYETPKITKRGGLERLAAQEITPTVSGPVIVDTLPK